MKDSAHYATLLKKLCNRLRRQFGSPSKMAAIEPTTAIILACLSAHTTEKKARSVLKKIRQNFVDFNELRVSRAENLEEVLGKGFPQGRNVSRQIIGLLKQIYDERDSLDLTGLCRDNKRQAKAFLESLEYSTPYVVARVMLQSIDAHAFPVHYQMLNMLLKEEVVAPNADAADVQGFLERQISVSQIQKIYPLLRQHADGFRAKRSGGKKTKTKKVDANTTRTTKTNVSQTSI